PFFEIPNWAVRLVVLLLIIGFPVALILAWAFELTPEGIKRIDVAETMPTATGQKKHAWIYIVVIGGAISVALFFLGRYTVGNTATPRPSEAATKSIAVLPFVDMSEKKDQEYFADGLSEELIGMLTTVPELKVPARTSSFYFKGKQTTIADIAKALGVAHVLEGSVRKSGNTLRITAQ